MTILKLTLLALGMLCFVTNRAVARWQQKAIPVILLLALMVAGKAQSVPATHPSHTRDTFYTFFYEGNPVKIPASMCKRDKVGTVCEAAEEHCLIPTAACDPSRPSDECDACISRYVIFKFPAKHHSTAPRAHQSHRRIIHPAQHDQKGHK